MWQSIKLPIHRDGWKFIAVFAGLSLAMGFFSNNLGWLGVILTGWCIYLFRDPERVTPKQEGLIVSPADGIICSITNMVSPPDELGINDENTWTKISIFLNIFDVHVNRIPIGGTITKSAYHPGKFFNASLDKASIHNERQSILISTINNYKIIVVQIAGLIARRIVCDIDNDQDVNVGDRYGMIRFGSRVDTYLPQGVMPIVIKGQRMIAGETVLASLNAINFTLKDIKDSHLDE